MISPGRNSLIAGGLLLILCSCRKPPSIIEASVPVGAHDRTFHSLALGRDVTYRVILPMASTKPVCIVYLLHGNGDSFRTWSMLSKMAELAAGRYLLVMPEGHSSYFVNSASKAEDRYEDFLAQDLIADAERDLPRRTEERDRAIVGVSMGGFAAVVLALKHPALYRFAGALSPAIDYAERGFTPLRLEQSLAVRSIFGGSGSPTRKANDPFVLAANASSETTPYIFFSVGADEALLEPVKRFDALLTERRLAHEFRVEAGGHNWQQWNELLPSLVDSMESRLSAHLPASVTPAGRAAPSEGQAGRP